MDASALFVAPTRQRSPARLRPLLAGLVLLGLGGHAAAELPPLPEEEQARVKKAIERGVRYLQATREMGGTWAPPGEGLNAYRVGYAALPGLTLLECGVPPTHRSVQQAAGFVRRNAARSDRTYELALAILFLDRLGDKKDQALIETCALRLIAGQSVSGGWGYTCPEIGPATQKELWAALRRLEQQPALVADGAKALKGPPAAAPAKPAALVLPERFRALAVFRDPDLMPTLDPLRRNYQTTNPTTDNSNTQFAVLGLWAAGRHNLPVSRTLARIVLRFDSSQNYDGSWGYWHRVGGDTGRPPMLRRSMDCVGLLALAVGHGLARNPAEKAPAPKVVDPRILKGFVALSEWIGPPPAPPTDPSLIDYYFLWSVERVAVLYGLPAIADKDWYRWGCQALLPNQSATGAWERGSYRLATPAANTCFALLFLKRANLAADLAARIPFRPAELNRAIAQQAAELPPRSGSSHGGNAAQRPPAGSGRPPGRPPGND
jgi:hypothetical protein